MPKVKRQDLYNVTRNAEFARRTADAKETGDATEKAAMNLSRGPKKGIKKVFPRFATKEEIAAARLMTNSRAAEMERSAARGKSVTKRAKAKAEKAKTTRALTGQASKPSRKVTKRSVRLSKTGK
jgi:hypothetical protein